MTTAGKLWCLLSSEHRRKAVVIRELMLTGWSF